MFFHLNLLGFLLKTHLSKKHRLTQLHSKGGKNIPSFPLILTRLVNGHSKSGQKTKHVLGHVEHQTRDSHHQKAVEDAFLETNNINVR